MIIIINQCISTRILANSFFTFKLKSFILIYIVRLRRFILQWLPDNKLSLYINMNGTSLVQISWRTCRLLLLVVFERRPPGSVTGYLLNLPVTPLLTWLNFNPGMDKYKQAWWSVGWNYVCIAEAWEWISTFIQHCILDVIIYPCCD